MKRSTFRAAASVLDATTMSREASRSGLVVPGHSGICLALALVLLASPAAPGVARGDAMTLDQLETALKLGKPRLDIKEGSSGADTTGAPDTDNGGGSEATQVKLGGFSLDSNPKGGVLVVLDTLPNGGLVAANKDTVTRDMTVLSGIR